MNRTDIYGLSPDAPQGSGNIVLAMATNLPGSSPEEELEGGTFSNGGGGPSAIVVGGDIATERTAAEETEDAATLVCLGGACTADRFENGSGVTIDSNGNLQGVSINSAPNVSLDQLTATIPNGQVSVTTLGDIEAIGGIVTPASTLNNPFHCILCGITPEQAEELFTPTIPNPSQ